MQTPRTGKFVHVVASVELDAGTGTILYVNPSSVSTSPEPTEPVAAGLTRSGGTTESEFMLRVEDGEGRELGRFIPAIQLPSDAPEGARTGLLDEDIPYRPDMKRIVLMHGETPVSVYEAGAPSELPAGSTPPAEDLRMGTAPPGHPEKRSMEISGLDRPEPGVSYTIQVRPEGSGAWQTIAVGRPTARFSVDRNQFPGADKASVRVVRTTGFEDAVVAERDIDFRFDE